MPVEVAGVVGVTANGNRQLKSFYSSYGVGSADVIAPGGDSVLQLTAAAPNGRVLSTWPASLAGACARKVFDGARRLLLPAGHLDGLAARRGRRGAHREHGGAPRARSRHGSQNTADPIACPPDLSIYAFFPAVDNGAPQVCTGGAGYNSFNGHGQVNALTAVGG